MRRDKKKRLARTFTIAIAVLLLLIFIVRDVFRENLKDVHDSVLQAKALYEILYEQRQNDSAMRSEAQSFVDLHNKFRNLQNPPNQPGPWKPALASDIADLSSHALVTLNKAQDELYFVSELIDALPSSAADLADLRKLRDESRVHLEQDATSVTTVLSPIIQGPPGLLEPEVDSRRAWEEYETISTDHGRVLHLGVRSVQAANHALKIMERRIRICSDAIYVLGLVVLALGIYAAVAGLKPEGNEANR